MLDFSQAISTIQQSNNILILPSAPADGDSISSALALFSVLKGQGKNPTVVLSSDVPSVYEFLPESGVITKEANLSHDLVITIDLTDSKLKDLRHEVVDNKVNVIVTPESGTLRPDQVSFPEAQSNYDLLITVDCASLDQLGDFYANHSQIFGEVPSLNIDHHHSNANFASINLVDPTNSSTTQILYALFKQMGIQMTPDLATLLLAGIITDTGSFQNANTTPESFDIAAGLIDQGARQQEIIRHVYKTKQLETLKLWGKILSNIQVDAENKVVWTGVSRAMFEETGTTEDDIGDIIDELLANAQEAEVVILLEERSDGSLHGSIRTRSEARDATKIAAVFGGGGHLQAAGFTIPNATIAEKEPEILAAAKQGAAVQSPEAVVETPLETNVQVPAEPVINEPANEVQSPFAQQEPEPEVAPAQQPEPIVPEQTPIEPTQPEPIAQAPVSEPEVQAEPEVVTPKPEPAQQPNEQPQQPETDLTAIPDFIAPNNTQIESNQEPQQDFNPSQDIQIGVPEAEPPVEQPPVEQPTTDQPAAIQPEEMPAWLNPQPENTENYATDEEDDIAMNEPVQQENPEKTLEDLTRSFVSGGQEDENNNKPVENKPDIASYEVDLDSQPSGPPAPLI